MTVFKGKIGSAQKEVRKIGNCHVGELMKTENSYCTVHVLDGWFEHQQFWGTLRVRPTVLVLPWYAAR